MSGLWGLATIDRASVTACPPWCTRDIGHGSTDGFVYHEGRETVVKLDVPNVSAATLACRDDLHGEQGTAYVYLCGDGPIGPVDYDWTASISPTAALQLGRALTDPAFAARLGQALITAATEAGAAVEVTS
ncbi:hypothetical protein GCM10009827_083970 [Dactylosporangium maewongense]|uniref:DUF317 domain-containing protein n=1 Tax=Dactylosporangium maewongense TaxID=634393 RepID=A0ABN2C084_9ACTN